MRHPASRLRAALTAPLLGLCTACTAPPPPPPAAPADDPRWAPRLERQGEALVVTGWTATEGSPQAARDRLREELLARAAEEAIAGELPPDAQADPEGLRAVRRKRGDWVASARVLEEGGFAEGARVGMRLRVEVRADVLRQVLEQEGLLQTRRARVIVVLRRGADGPALVAQDLGEGISGELTQRGYVPRLWRDVRLEVGQERDAGDPHLEELLVKYVEDSDWRKPEDERYDLPLLLLRAEGRFLAGFQALELKRARTELSLPGEASPTPVESVHLTVRGDLYDLLQGTSLGVITRSGSAPLLEGRTEVEVTAELTGRLTRELAREMCNLLSELSARERRLRGRTYTLAFEGYARPERERIEWLLSKAVAEDVRSEGPGADRLVVRIESSREAIPLREELRRALRALKLAPSSADGSGQELVFRR